MTKQYSVLGKKNWSVPSWSQIRNRNWWKRTYGQKKKKRRRENEIKKTWIKTIRINPDSEKFNIQTKIGKIYIYSNESNKKLTEESTKKSLINKISRRLSELEFKENHSIIFIALMPIVKKYYHHYKTCKLIVQAVKYTNNIGLKKAIMTNKVIRDKLRYVNCMSDKSRFLKQNNNKKSGWNNINPKLSIY